MKKILLILSLFISSYAFAQYPTLQNQGSDSTMIKSKGAYWGGKGIVNAYYEDTIAANLSRIAFYANAQIITDSGTLWIRNPEGTGWRTFIPPTGFASVTKVGRCLLVRSMAETLAPTDSLLYICADSSSLNITGDSMITFYPWPNQRRIAEKIIGTNIYNSDGYIAVPTVDGDPGARTVRIADTSVLVFTSHNDDYTGESSNFSQSLRVVGFSTSSSSDGASSLTGFFSDGGWSTSLYAIGKNYGGGSPDRDIYATMFVDTIGGLKFREEGRIQRGIRYENLFYDSTQWEYNTLVTKSYVDAHPEFNGTATLSSGTVIVSCPKIKTGSRIWVSVNTPSGTQGFLSAPVASIINDTSFVINSTSASENSTVNWQILNP